MNPTLVRSSECRMHADRPAVARCPGCGQPFCLECVTEHEGKYLCAPCLRDRVRSGTTAPVRVWGVLRPLHVLGAVLITWMLFYLLGLVLLRIPADWHEGTIVEQWVDESDIR